jgi:hypothetical protein
VKKWGNTKKEGGAQTGFASLATRMSPLPACIPDTLQVSRYGNWTVDTQRTKRNYVNQLFIFVKRKMRLSHNVKSVLPPPPPQTYTALYMRIKLTFTALRCKLIYRRNVKPCLMLFRKEQTQNIRPRLDTL